MLARRKLRRRIDDALAVASPLALADAMDAHICSRSREELRSLVTRSANRMDASDRAQMALYLNPDDADDLIGHRFSAFLRQNPRAISSLDEDAVDSILCQIGELPPVQHNRRKLSAASSALIAVIIAVALLPLAAQYAHQRGLLEGLSEPMLAPPIVPFIQHVIHPGHAALPHRHNPARVAYHAQPVRRPVTHHRAVPRHVAAVKPRTHRPRLVAWKFDRKNNPYFNPVRWHHPFVVARSAPRPAAHSTARSVARADEFGERARMSVRSYLHAVIAGDFPAALAHLGLPSSANSNAISELPIVARDTRIAIVGSNPQAGGKERVQAHIVTGGRQYFEVFNVEHDGPAIRIADRFYIPVNRSAQVAARLQTQHPHR